MFNGIQNFLRIISDNWITILVIVSILVGIWQRAKIYFSKSDDEKIEIAKQQIKEIILKLVSDAETDYTEWSKAGSIKRAQVIQKIFSDYPILSKITDQEEIIKWIDKVIDESLQQLKEIIYVNGTNSTNK